MRRTGPAIPRQSDAAGGAVERPGRRLRGRIVTAIDLRRRLSLPPAPAEKPRMSVVAEQGGELYALLVDQVSEVMSLKASAFERNPPTLPQGWAQFSSGIYRLDGRLLVVLDVGNLLALGEAA